MLCSRLFFLLKTLKAMTRIAEHKQTEHQHKEAENNMLERDLPLPTWNFLLLCWPTVLDSYPRPPISRSWFYHIPNSRILISQNKDLRTRTNCISRVYNTFLRSQLSEYFFLKKKKEKNQSSVRI